MMMTVAAVRLPRRAPLATDVRRTLNTSSNSGRLSSTMSMVSEAREDPDGMLSAPLGGKKSFSEAVFAVVCQETKTYRKTLVHG